MMLARHTGLLAQKEKGKPMSEIAEESDKNPLQGTDIEEEEKS